MEPRFTTAQTLRLQVERVWPQVVEAPVWEGTVDEVVLAGWQQAVRATVVERVEMVPTGIQVVVAAQGGQAAIPVVA